MAVTTTMRSLMAMAIVVPLLISYAAFPATQQDYDDCSQTDNLDRSVAACSRIIASPDASAADRAAALIQLGNDDAASGKLDEAIADYSGAIQLDPKSTLAYAARAIAYWRKNDRDHAVADYNQAAAIDASELRGMTVVNAELGAIGQFADQRVQQANDPTPISDRALLNEIRERLYELNFDPGSLDGTPADDTNHAIQEFQQKNNLPPSGLATMGLLRQLRQAGTLKPWGTIVYDEESGKWGMAWDESTRKASVARARASCGEGGSCPVEISFFGNKCGAFAHSASSWAIDARDDIRKAKDAALMDCGKRGRSCKLIASVCADGTEQYSAAK